MSAARPVTIDGVEYSSITAAAKALGVSMTNLYVRLRREGMEPRVSIANAALRAGVSAAACKHGRTSPMT